MSNDELTARQELNIRSKNFGVEDYDGNLLHIKFSLYRRLDSDIEEGKKVGHDMTDEIIQKTLTGAGIQMFYEKKAKLKEGIWVGLFIGFLVGLAVGMP